ncbi:MAG: hypothetical protein OEY89_14125 [Gammaproteobacteria bacterium]|nr:hypothetical protein [Gammaproteobacteria bacterium]
MPDTNCLAWVIPAITLGYAVVNDPEGKLRFWNEKADIKYRDDYWQAQINIDEDHATWRHYLSLRDALESEAV